MHTILSRDQLDELEYAFRLSHYPDIYAFESLISKVKVEKQQIEMWFENRREEQFKKLLLAFARCAVTEFQPYLNSPLLLLLLLLFAPQKVPTGMMARAVVVQHLLPVKTR
uniref:Homeobox domain-containing protein n=1 Tax=Globodera pallida TaxID=36090 RepID=A0A183BN96_GLOPA